MRVFILVLVFPVVIYGSDFTKMSREERCRQAQGQVAGHNVAQSLEDSHGKKLLLAPIDCTCGGKRFNPLQEGDICRNAKILQAFDRYCEDSQGNVVAGSTLPRARKCMCGNTEFKPTAKTKCAGGKVVD